LSLPVTTMALRLYAAAMPGNSRIVPGPKTMRPALANSNRNT
jgi:hypothetical protein